MTDSLTIRKAAKEDCEGIRALIQELADYEKMPEGPKISAADLVKDGFSGDSAPFFQAHVAQLSNELVGFVLFYYTYSTWEGKSVYMEDLYVQPAHRGKGIGTKLWRSVCRESLKIGCSRCNFQVLDWNKPSIDYYKRKGAVDLSAAEGWLVFRLPKPQMEQLVAEEESSAPDVSA